MGTRGREIVGIGVDLVSIERLRGVLWPMVDRMQDVLERLPTQPAPVGDFVIKQKIHYKMVGDSDLKADVHGDGAQEYSYSQSFINIRTPNGKLYAYVVLLFNENPHFVNMIQEHSIPVEKMQKDGFHIAEYRNYLKNLREPATYRIAEQLLAASLQPRKYTDKILDSLRDALEKRNIILRFSRDRKGSDEERIIQGYGPSTVQHMKNVILLILGIGDLAKIVLIFLGVPLVAGYLTRLWGERTRGVEWYEQRFIPRIAPFALPGAVTADISFKHYRVAEILTYLPIVTRVDAHTVRFVGRNILEVSRFLEFVNTYQTDLTP